MRGQAPAPPGGGSSGGGPGGSHSRAAADLRGRPLHRAHPRQAAAGDGTQGGTRHQEPTEPDWRHSPGTEDEGRPQTRWRLVGIFGNLPSPSATCQHCGPASHRRWGLSAAMLSWRLTPSNYLFGKLRRELSGLIAPRWMALLPAGSKRGRPRPQPLPRTLTSTLIRFEPVTISLRNCKGQKMCYLRPLTQYREHC